MLRFIYVKLAYSFQVLKKEIDLFQLQLYGYCLFRALASLHKQGIIHRDVKPGNFLFSRMVNKGYLIDFNLAMDMYKKYEQLVLLKSLFQGPKIDVWSAGVTLVYLSTGRSPFGGDPDQNIMDIAILRGSEDLWEVAKLHNCESSFPVQLLDAQYFPSKKLPDWLGLNTKRPELLKDLSRSFFDLVDKCLTVNSRLRISAEDAIKHEFFSTCHKQLKQQRRRLRQGLRSNSATACIWILNLRLVRAYNAKCNICGI